MGQIEDDCNLTKKKKGDLRSKGVNEIKNKAKASKHGTHTNQNKIAHNKKKNLFKNFASVGLLKIHLKSCTDDLLILTF